MSAYQYYQLLQMLAEVGQEVFDNQVPACDFSEDSEPFEMDDNYSQLWSDRS